jgi:hypothetical protein
MKYVITVQEWTDQPDANTPGQAFEVLKVEVKTFDLLTFVQALTQKPRGRPAKAAKPAIK